MADVVSRTTPKTPRVTKSAHIYSFHGHDGMDQPLPGSYVALVMFPRFGPTLMFSQAPTPFLGIPLSLPSRINEPPKFHQYRSIAISAGISEPGFAGWTEQRGQEVFHDEGLTSRVH